MHAVAAWFLISWRCEFGIASSVVRDFTVLTAATRQKLILYFSAITSLSGTWWRVVIR